MKKCIIILTVLTISASSVLSASSLSPTFTIRYEDFINDLRPRKFKKVNPAKYPDSIRKQNDGRDREGNEYEWTDAQANKVWDGLIAQEVKEAVDKAGTSYSGWNIEKNSKESVTYSTLVTPLIKAVQELSEMVKSQQKEIEELKKR